MKEPAMHSNRRPFRILAVVLLLLPLLVSTSVHAGFWNSVPVTGEAIRKAQEAAKVEQARKEAEARKAEEARKAAEARKAQEREQQATADRERIKQIATLEDAKKAAKEMQDKAVAAQNEAAEARSKLASDRQQFEQEKLSLEGQKEILELKKSFLESQGKNLKSSNQFLSIGTFTFLATTVIGGLTLWNQRRIGRREEQLKDLQILKLREELEKGA